MKRISIAIGGFGAAGAALALALHAKGVPADQILIADPAADAPTTGNDTRIMALNPASLRFLEAIGVGEVLETSGFPLKSIALTDTSLEAIARPLLLGFSAGETDQLARMVPLSALQSALRSQVRTRGIAVQSTALSDVRSDEMSGVTVACGDETYRAQLVVAADGARSNLRQKAGISVIGWGYSQIAISAVFRHSAPHNGEAVQHFLPSGTFAMLPLDEGLSSLVWSENADSPEAAITDPATIIEAIASRAAGWRGEILGLDAISRHPLSLQLARRFYAPRLALLADAAHVVHPLAGQGLNLGLMDAEALAFLVADRMKLGLDPGAPEVLETYQAMRRPPALAMASATDALNRLFSNDSTPLRLVRDFGLGLVERSDRLKSALRRAAGG